MCMENELPKRKIPRLREFDYATRTYYFLTICCKDRQHLFGKVVGAAYMPPVRVCLSETGKIAERNLLAIEAHNPQTQIIKYVIMPDHLQVFFSVGDGGEAAAFPPPPPPTVPRIMNSYKASVSRDAGFPVWQRSFHDHIIRNKSDFEETWKYIDNNPVQWVLDGKA